MAALVLQYYLLLRSVLRTRPLLRRCLARCRHCRIFFLTHWCNAGRKDLGCPFSCRTAYSVYVILLEPGILRHPSIIRLNPNRDPAKPCVYVGMTGMPVEQRFANHPGLPANRVPRPPLAAVGEGMVRTGSSCQTREPEEIADGHDQIAVFWIATWIGQLHALAGIPAALLTEVGFRIVH